MNAHAVRLRTWVCFGALVASGCGAKVHGLTAGGEPGAAAGGGTARRSTGGGGVDGASEPADAGGGRSNGGFDANGGRSHGTGGAVADGGAGGAGRALGPPPAADVAPCDGLAPGTGAVLARGLGNAYAISAGPSAIYVTDGVNGRVLRVAKNGQVDVLASDLPETWAIVHANRRLYFTSGLSLSAVDDTGGPVEQLVLAGTGFAIAYVPGRVLWPSYFGDAIHAFDLATGSLEVVADGQHLAHDIAADADGVFWALTNGDKRSIVASTPDGAKPETLVGEAGSLGLDADYVYWGEGLEGRLKRVPRSGGRVEVLSAGPARGDVVVDGGVVYWVDSGHDDGSTGEAIMKTSVDGGGDTVVATSFEGVAHLLALDGSCVYWTDPVAGTVSVAAR